MKVFCSSGINQDDPGAFRGNRYLMQQLIDGGRNEDLKRAVSDERYREQLYMEASLF